MIFWAYLYVVICTVAEIIIKHWELTDFIKIIFMICYVCFFLLWINKSQKNDYLRLKRNNYYETLKMIELLPLMVLPVFNVGTYGFKFDFYTTITMLCVAIIEEIFFRGFLQRWFEKTSMLGAVCFTNIIFAAFHILNYVPNKEIVPLLIQMLIALCVGMCFSIIAIRNDSIIPCIVIHFLINVTGNNNIGEMNILIVVICAMIYFFYGIYLWKRKK